MKKLLIICALGVFTLSSAQVDKNTNTEKRTVVTKKAVTDDKGTDVATKTVTQTQKQVLKLDDTDAGQTNQSVVMKPVKVDTDVSYDYNGNRFQFINQKDENGYRMMNIRDNATNEEYAIIKPTSQNGYYIMSKSGDTSFGYFNAEGNFVVERYDRNTKTVKTDVYKLQNNSIQKDKM